MPCSGKLYSVAVSLLTFLVPKIPLYLGGGNNTKTGDQQIKIKLIALIFMTR